MMGVILGGGTSFYRAFDWAKKTADNMSHRYSRSVWN